MTQKIFVSLIVIALIATVVIVVVMAPKDASAPQTVVENGATTTTAVAATTTTPSPTTEPASTLKSYSNTSYAFSFSYPKTYQDTTASRNSNVPLVSLEKNNAAIAVRRIVPKTGQSYQDALIADVIYDPKGDHPQSFGEFKTRTITGKEFNWIVTGKFEGVLSINYYLKRPKDILVFSMQSRGVDWTNTNFDVEKDPVHVDLKNILATLKTDVAQDKTLDISLYYTNSKSSQFKTSCEAFEKVTRTIPWTAATADAALRELFKGPTPAEQTKGLRDPYHLSSDTSLGEAYIGVTVVDGTAKINFKKDALTYFNSSACNQESIKSSIQKTLTQFASIEHIEYSIEGKLFTQWNG